MLKGHSRPGLGGSRRCRVEALVLGFWPWLHHCHLRCSEVDYRAELLSLSLRSPFEVLVLVLGAQVLVLVLDTKVLVLEEKSLVVSLFLVFFSWHLQSRFLQNLLPNRHYMWDFTFKRWNIALMWPHVIKYLSLSWSPKSWSLVKSPC